MIVNNQIKSSNLNDIINKNLNSVKKTNDNIKENINIGYSIEKKMSEEKEEKSNIINNKDEFRKNEKNRNNYLYNNFIDKIYDKNKDNNQNINDVNINRNLFGKDEKKIKTQKNINANRINSHLKMSKSCNLKNDNKNMKIINENNNPNKSQNVKRSLICDKNTINIQLSIKRQTRSANDIKKHMSYYLIDGNIKNQNNGINNIQRYINNFSSNKNFSNDVPLNSFLPLQISSNKNISKNLIKYINTPHNIFKNSFKDKIMKKMNQINTNKKYRYQKNKNNYINLEFFEESKQDNFFGKPPKNFYGNNNKLFEMKTKDIEKNKFDFQNKFYEERNNNKENNIFFSNSKLNHTSDNKNNYLFKTYSTNNSKKRIFSYFPAEHKSLDFYKEKNDLFGLNFNSDIYPIKKSEFKYNNNFSNKLFNNSKNILFPKMKESKSFTTIFQNKEKTTYSFLYINNYNNKNHKSNLNQKDSHIFSTNYYF